MAKKSASVTPKADAEAAKFAAYYASDEHFEIKRSDLQKARCKCGCHLSYAMSAYAFHRGNDEVLMTTQCGRSFWLKLT